jgi:hypothetical protein
VLIDTSCGQGRRHAKVGTVLAMALANARRKEWKSTGNVVGVSV